MDQGQIRVIWIKACCVEGAIVFENHQTVENFCMDQMLTVRQAAERLGVSNSLVYLLCRDRFIRHERHGRGRGTIRISSRALDEYRQTSERAADEMLDARQPRLVKGPAFRHLNAERLRESWRQQDVLVPQPDGDSARSSGSSCDP